MRGKRCGQIFGLLALLWILPGCQGFHQTAQTEDDQEAAFRRQWTAYTHCRTSTDPVVMSREADRLTQFASQRQGPPALFTGPLGRWVADPPVRLSVDPQRLAAACALGKGQTALADEMFRRILRRHQEADYAYYVEQAGQGLAQLHSWAGTISRPRPVSLP
jgi:hypothetical protein